MLRRDYVLRMIEEFVQALARLRSLKGGRRWEETAAELDSEFQKLIGEGAEAVAQRTETDLLTRLMREGPTHALRDRTLMLVTLLTEAGDVATAKDQSLTGRECHLKALHLLLEVLAQGEVFDCPEFVPTVELLRTRLREERLPLRSHAMLMRHYEAAGEFARAEDELFAVLEAEPDNPAIVEFGIPFYQRLLAQSDATLSAANLPRAEVLEGLQELQARQRRFAALVRNAPGG